MWISNLDSRLRLSELASPRDSSAGRRARPRAAARPVRDRTRRRLVASLRVLANRTASRSAAQGRFEVLLLDRLALVRGDLLEIAALLEVERAPDPVCVATLQRLLTDGCESPLYNRDVHPSELRAALYFVRSRLAGTGEA